MVSPIVRHQNILQLNMAERVQQTQQQHPDMQQRYFAIQFGQEQKKLLQKVKTSEETDRLELNEDDHKKNNNHNEHFNEDHPKDSPEEFTDAQAEHGHIDIKA